MEAGGFRPLSCLHCGWYPCWGDSHYWSQWPLSLELKVRAKCKILKLAIEVTRKLTSVMAICVGALEIQSPLGLYKAFVNSLYRVRSANRGFSLWGGLCLSLALLNTEEEVKENPPYRTKTEDWGFKKKKFDCSGDNTLWRTRMYPTVHADLKEDANR